jgi:hypothetical protein
MDLILRGYHVDDPTWSYLSFLLILAVYFKFSRLWSVRNLDLLLLLSISPGLLLVRDDNAPTIIAFGYAWLFGISALLLLRVLYDGLITRRPRLEQNMNAAGMAFLCLSTFLFLTAKLLTESPPASTVESIRKANQLIEGQAAAPHEPALVEHRERAEPSPDAASAGPGTSLVAGSVAQLSKVVAQHSPEQAPSPTDIDVITARLIAVIAHLAVIVGLALVGRHIFADPDLGFAMATLYMLLPCTAFDVGKINHVLPAAFVVWAILAYRRPFVSGTLLGLACAMMFFPIFLLPLWAAFYGRNGGLRFGAAVGLTTVLIVSSLVLLSNDSQTVWREMMGYVDWRDLPFFVADNRKGIWAGIDSAYRIPVFVTYLVMLVALTIWPRRKSLAQVITHSAAIVIGTQFWYPQQGGVYVLWYLPLLLLVLFRPLMTNHLAPEFKPLDLRGRLGLRERKQPELAGSAAGGSPALP